MKNDADFEDFEDLDKYLNSAEFDKDYNEATYNPTGKSWSDRTLDYSGMTIEDFGR